MNTNAKFKKGDIVLISPEVTHQIDWIEGAIIEIENNPYVGVVLVVETKNGDVFFERECLFKSISEEFEKFSEEELKFIALSKEEAQEGKVKSSKEVHQRAREIIGNKTELKIINALEEHKNGETIKINLEILWKI